MKTNNILSTLVQRASEGKRLNTTKPSSAARKHHQRRRPFLERLEERTVLASFVEGIGGAGTDYFSPVHAVDPSFSSYLTGYISSQPADFNPGPGTLNLSSNGGNDTFLAKYAADGSLAWARSFGGSGDDQGKGTAFAHEAGGDFVYLTGYFTGSVDFGAGIGVLNSAGGADYFVAKFDAATGAGVWAKNAGGAADDRADSDITAANGKVYITGNLLQSTDFDPGPASAVLSPIAPPDTGNGFVWTLDSDGNYVAAWELGTEIISVVVESDSLYLRGRYRATTDFDSGAGIQSRTPASSANIYLASYSIAGQSPSNPVPAFGWVQSIDVVPSTTGSIGHDSTSLYVATGIATATNGSDAFAASIRKSDGAIQWSKQFGGSGSESATSPYVDETTGSLYVASYFASATVDFDPSALGGEVVNSSSSGTQEGYILKLNATTGGYQQVWQLGGTGNDNAKVNYASGAILSAFGSFESTAYFPTGGTLTSQGGMDGYFMSLNQTDPPPPPPPPPSTKFYVADDGTTNKTFEYAANGASIENYNINSGNSAPRGAASTIAGDKVWVADANKNVYVYNTSGGLLGSWAAGSLAANADVQGITTNGTDVWLVDAKQDKVFKYSGAATRLSGTQTAASSFSLSSSNTDATDLVTDGTSIWVLNNSSTDKIFKYTVSGALQGSWTITSAGGSPTGLTIDPASVSSIWIVDSSTDRIYEFASAISRTSGSAPPTTSFPLAATNTNPQGLADPPPAVGSIPSVGTSDFSYDAALLGIVSELESLLSPSGKKRG